MTREVLLSPLWPQAGLPVWHRGLAQHLYQQHGGCMEDGGSEHSQCPARQPLPDGPKGRRLDSQAEDNGIQGPGRG